MAEAGANASSRSAWLIFFTIIIVPDTIKLVFAPLVVEGKHMTIIGGFFSTLLEIWNSTVLRAIDIFGGVAKQLTDAVVPRAVPRFLCYKAH